MYKKTITYTDYNDVQRTEDFYFSLSEAEITEMQLGVEGGYAAMIDKIIKAKDTPALIKIFKELLLKSYGIKSDDGRRFIKSEQLSLEFTQTPAYSELYMMLATDDKQASAFIKNIMPAKLVAKADELEKQGKIQSLPTST
jgi:hypothetical protein